MDINATDFAENFKLENATVGLIGQGFVGSAMRAFFERKVKVVSYDKYKQDPTTGAPLDVVINMADIVFICVPTPMRKTGECFTGIVESVFEDVFRTANEIGRPLHTFVVCLKSTVPPGFTEKMQDKYPDMRIVFSPEFLTEKNSVQDMLQANRVIVGGKFDDARIVLQFFLAVDRRRIDEGKCVLVATTSPAAEMAKLFGNGLLFAKVLFANEVYVLCQAMGINYEEVRVLTALDPRIGAAHTAVPGPDGHLGAGGHCFPKDMYNLKYTAAEFNVPQRMFTAVLERNGEVRNERDWEKMGDRAVTDQ